MSATTMQRHEFPDGAALAPAFAQWTANLLQKGVDERGEAVLIVSGGNTPKRYFAALAQRPIDWARVTITLADERCVADDSPRSNARLLRENLLRDHASAARFAPLADSRLSPDQELAAARARIADLPLPADLVVLGMGDDGHTASWFPGADNLAEAIDPGARNLVLPMRAPGALEPRLTLTARVILRARALALHIEGADKLATLARAAAEGPVEAMPIRAALRGASDRLTIFSASS
ncbi:MAG TPA: 6-phosphogluconolactonase [Roseiarcus sp.]|jgi:6-phosphogluconolactonase